MEIKQRILTFFLFSISIFPAFCQTDTTGNKIDSAAYRVEISKTGAKDMADNAGGANKSWLRRNPGKALVAPVILVGLGAALINNPVYDRFDARRDLNRTFKNFGGTKVDDYLIFAPYVELVALNLLKIKCENDFVNTLLIIVKSEIINNALTFGVKYITNIERPNGEKYAWPSGHTSQAFLAAAIVNREFRYKSKWYGIGAYTIAGSVGLFRMLNNKHWLSDVVAGAGFGIFSANITYITHKWRWGRPGTCFVPTYNNGAPGFMMVHQF